MACNFFVPSRRESYGLAKAQAALDPGNSADLQMQKTDPMSETRAVELKVELPRAFAAEVEEVQRLEPEVLSRILLYGLTRRAIFDTLAGSEYQG